MTTPMPDDVYYGKVAGRFILAIGDGSDPDALPDAVPAIGYVTFMSALDNFNLEAPDPTNVVPYRVRCTFDADGYLIDPDGNLGVWLVVGVYTVFYTLENGEIDKHVIEVTVEHTADSPLQLPNAMPPGGPVLTVSEYTELSGRIDGLDFVTDEELAAEAALRAAADSVLDTRVVELENAVPDLSGYATTDALATEATARANADAALDGRIDTLEAVPPVDLTPYATDADLTAEAATRASADAALDTRVDALEAVPAPDLSGYATDAELTAEATARANADSALDTRVDALEAAPGVDLSGYATDAELSAEASARAAADAALDSRLDAVETGGPDLSSYATDAELAAGLATKANTSHNHDDRYFTEGEVTTALAGKSDTTHTHDSRYYTESEIDTMVGALDTGKAPVIHLHGKGDITDFTEAVQDEVGSMFVAAGGTYVDASGAIGFPSKFGKFRGPWSSMSVVSSIDVGSAYPSAFSTVSGWVTKLRAAGLNYFPFAVPGGTQPTDDYVISSGIWNGGGAPGSWKTPTVTAVPAGVTLARMKVLLAHNGDPANFKLAIMVNGTRVSEHTTPNSQWVEKTIPVAPGDILGLTVFDQFSSGASEARFADIEYGVAADPYMLGEHVTHLNRLWRSLVDNNGETPGTGSNWTEVQLTIDAADITDSTSVGRALLTAADAAVARAAAGITVYDTETVQDVVGALVTAAGGTYNDTSGTIGLPAGGLGPTAWMDYTPDITGSTTNPTLGTGSLIKGRYRLNGNYVEGVIWIHTGTAGSAAGSGVYSVGLPPGITADTSDAIIMSVGSVSHSTFTDRAGAATLVPSGSPGRLRVAIGADYWGSANGPVAINQRISISFAFALSAGGGLAGTAAHTHESTGITDFAAAVDSRIAVQAINAQVDTYTPVLADAGKLITMTKATGMNLNVPTDATVAFAVGTRIDVLVLGAGMVTVAAVTPGTTAVNGTPSLVSRAQYSGFSLIKVAANSWVVVGDLA